MTGFKNIPLIPNNIIVKEKNEKYLVFNPNVPSWIVTNITGLMILQCCDGKRNLKDIEKLLAGKASEQEIMNLISYASQKKLFQIEKEKYSPPFFPLRSIYLNVTEKCNLKCLYCYANERENTQLSLGCEDYFNLLDSIKDLSANPIVTFTGGEPLLFDGLFDVASYAKKGGMQAYLLTNGTLISKDNIKAIIDIFDLIKISLDGDCSEINDQTRGAGSFDKITSGMKMLEKYGKEYRVSMTVTKRNINNIKEMNDRFGDKLNYAPYFHRREDQLNKHLAVTGADYFYALKNVAGINPYCEIDSVINANIQKRVIQKCSIADGSISIGANGDVFPCQLLHFNEFKAGNIHESSFQEIYLESPVLLKLREHTVDKINGCDKCFIAYLCGGGCIARHYYENGTIDNAAAFCEYEKLAILDSLIDRYEF